MLLIQCGMKKIAFWGGVVLASITTVIAGDTYDCVNSKTDYINYGPPTPVDHSAVIAGTAVAPDSARSEPRWAPMLGPDDLRDLLFIQARNQTDLVIHQSR